MASGKSGRYCAVVRARRAGGAGRTMCRGSACRSMVGETEPGDVDEGEELRVGEALAEHFEHLLAAAHAGEPVVDEARFIEVARVSEPQCYTRRPAQRTISPRVRPAAPIAPRRTAAARARAALACRISRRSDLVREHALTMSGARWRAPDRTGRPATRRVAGDLGQRRDVRRHDRRAARHGFERRQAESLVERREHEHPGQPVHDGERLSGR